MSVRAFGKRWLVGLTILGLVAGLLGAGPEGALGAHGEDDDVDNEPVYSACVGAATESFGFEDTVGAFAEEAIDSGIPQPLRSSHRQDLRGGCEPRGRQRHLFLSERRSRRPQPGLRRLLNRSRVSGYPKGA